MSHSYSTASLTYLVRTMLEVRPAVDLNSGSASAVGRQLTHLKVIREHI